MVGKAGAEVFKESKEAGYMKIALILLAGLLSSLVVFVVVLAVRRRSFFAWLNRTWRELEQPEQEASEAPAASDQEKTPPRFSPELVAGLPKPVQRYFLHAIAPGTPLASSVTLTMSGSIKLQKEWLSFTASELLSPFRGFIWKPVVSMKKKPLRGADYYYNGQAGMRFFMSFLPVVSASGPQIARSALGRMVGEAVWLPAALLPQRGIAWEALDKEHIQATVRVNDETHTLVLTIDDDGRLREMVFDRWSNKEQALIPFGLLAGEERTLGGYTIPARARVGWWYGSERFATEGEFFRCTIEEAEFR